MHHIGGYKYSFDGGPWSFEQSMLVYKRLNETEDPHTIILNEMDIWVQIYDIPKGFISVNILKSIGMYIGR